MGSFRDSGNTATLTSTVIRELENLGGEVEYIKLADKNLEPCTECWTCQNIFEGPCLWEGKKSGIITTCGYDINHGVGVFEEGVKRYSQHSKLEYIGKIAMRDNGNISNYMNESTIALAREFASKIVEKK